MNNAYKIICESVTYKLSKKIQGEITCKYESEADRFKIDITTVLGTYTFVFKSATTGLIEISMLSEYICHEVVCEFKKYVNRSFFKKGV